MSGSYLCDFLSHIEPATLVPYLVICHCPDNCLIHCNRNIHITNNMCPKCLLVRNINSLLNLLSTNTLTADHDVQYCQGDCYFHCNKDIENNTFFQHNQYNKSYCRKCALDANLLFICLTLKYNAYSYI